MKQYTDQTLKQLDVFAELVQKWNTRFNLTSYSADDLRNVGFFDCRVLAAVLRALNIASAGDVGTGYGMPGLVIKLLEPDIDMHLIDAAEKKIAFLEYASKILGIRVHVHLKRIPEPDWQMTFGCLLSKASMKENQLLKATAPHLGRGGRLVYYAGKEAPQNSRELPVTGKIVYRRPDGSVSSIIIRTKQ